MLARKPWPLEWGLCVAGDPANTDLPYDAFSNVDHSTTDFWGARPFLKNGDQTLWGGIVDLNGVGFGISLENIYRGYSVVNGLFVNESAAVVGGYPRRRSVSLS